MNNFNNPYVDPYSFQGNHFNYNRKATNSFHSHSSLTKQVGMEQKEPKQNADHNQNNKPKQQSIYTNRQIEKITGSKPIIFSPPKLNSNQKYMMNDEQQEQLTVDKDNTRDEDSEKKERVSSLMKEFSNLLDDDDLPILEESSILQEDTIDNESLSQSNEFSAEIDDKNDDENQFPSKQDKAKNLFDEFYSMLDESFDHSESEEIEALSDHVDTGEDPFLTMLSDNNELGEEKQDLSSTNLNEITSKQDKAKNLFDEFYSMLDESFDHSESEEIEALSDHVDTGEDPFLTMLSDNNELEEEKQDLSSTNLNEITSKQDKAKNLFDEFYSMLDESFDHSESEEIEALSDHVDTGEDPFLTMLSDNNELEEEKQDLSSTNLNEIKSVKLEDLSDHEKSHSTLDNDDHMLEKEEKDSSNAESSLSQGTKSSLQEKLYSKFKKNSPTDSEFASMLKVDQPKKEEKHEEDTQETELNINKEDSSLLDNQAPILEVDPLEKETESNTINKTSLKKKKSKKNSKNKNQYEIALLHDDYEQPLQKNSFLIESKDSEFKKNSPTDSEFASMLKVDQPNKEEKHEEDTQETELNINKEEKHEEDTQETELNINKEEKHEEDTQETELNINKEEKHEEDTQETELNINKEEKHEEDTQESELNINKEEKHEEDTQESELNINKEEKHEEDTQESELNINKEDSSSLDNQAPILEVDPLEKETESNTINKTSLKKKKSKKNSKNKNQYEIALLHDDYEQPLQKNSFLIESKDKKQTTIVKLQVLLAKLNIEIDIVENIKFFMPLENISKVEWSMRSLDCKVALPSTTLFLKGELIAEIEFINNGVNNIIHSLKVPIPWSKTTNIHWLTLPDLSHSYQNEFMFQSQHDPNGNFHYESYEKYAEAITSQLNQITFVSHHELDSKDQHLQIFGNAFLSINLMQEQFVDLECYSK